MWGGGKTGASDKTDGLADLDALTGVDVHPGEMEVHRLVAAGVSDVDHIAFTVPAPGEENAAGADGLDGRADRRGVINTQVGAVNLEDGMKSRVAEMRCNARAKLQRRAQKGLLQGLAVGGVVGGPAVCVMKQQRLIRAAGVVVFGGEDPAVGGQLSGSVFLFLQDHAKCVTATRVGVEIEVVAEDLRQAHGQLCRFTGALDGVEKRIVDFAADGNDLRTELSGADFDCEAAGRGNDAEHALRVNPVFDGAQVAIHRATDGDQVTGAYLPKIEN